MIFKNKIIIGLIIAILLVVIFSVAAFATRKTELIYETSEGKSIDIETFVHNGNRCYVAKQKNTNIGPSISCIRFEK